MEINHQKHNISDTRCGRYLAELDAELESETIDPPFLNVMKSQSLIQWVITLEIMTLRATMMTMEILILYVHLNL